MELLLALGTLLLPSPLPRQQPIEQLTSIEAVKIEPTDDQLRKLLKERYNEAAAEMNVRLEQVRAGKITHPVDLGSDLGLRLLHSGLEVFDQPAARIALLKRHLTFTRSVEVVMRIRIEAGSANTTPADLHQAKYYRADAEILLLREEEKARKAR